MQAQPVEMDKVYYKAFRKDYGGRKPRYQVDEVVYIKEAHAFIYYPDMKTAVAYADGEAKEIEFRILETTDPITRLVEHWHWKSPLFMPEWVARYFIKITDVSAERLQEITEEDAIAEGCPGIATHKSYPRQYRDSYEALWDSINPKQKWDTNPWVWKYSFIKIDK
jgi:hypothetical protein